METVPFCFSSYHPEGRGERLDKLLSLAYPGFSRTLWAETIHQGMITVNGRVTTSLSIRVPLQAVIQGSFPAREPLEDKGEEISLTKVFEDDQILVINKPAGLVVHPGAGNWQGTLLNAILYHYPESQHIPRAGIVHRLDKDTSGLMVIAKTEAAHTYLVAALKARQVKRLYTAWVAGVLNDSSCVINAPIGRDAKARTKMAVTPQGKEAITHVQVVRRFKDSTVIECALKTGRTHQIRVHLASMGHPLIGDTVYGGPRYATLPRQALHAHALGLYHPISKEWMTWTTPLAQDLKEVLDGLSST